MSDAAASGSPAPAVSVLLPVHNGARFLPATLRSLWRQTFTDFEVVAVDDASTDDTPAILAAEGDARLRVVRNEANLGLVGTLNRGLALCRGSFVARIDDDDLCEPERVAEQVRHLSEHRDLAGCGTWTTEIDEEDQDVGAQHPFPDPDYLRWSMGHTLRLYHPTVMLRRNVYEACGGYDPDYAHTEDYELWTRLAAQGHRIGMVPRALVRYRRRAGSITSKHRDHQRVVASQIAARYVGSLLGTDVPEPEVALMRALLSWDRPDPAALAHDRLEGALRLMGRFRHATLARAAPGARAAADEEVAGHLLRHGRMLLKEAPGSAWRIALYVARLPGHRRAGLSLAVRAVRCLYGATTPQ